MVNHELDTNVVVWSICINIRSLMGCWVNRLCRQWNVRNSQSLHCRRRMFNVSRELHRFPCWQDIFSRFVPFFLSPRPQTIFEGNFTVAINKTKRRYSEAVNRWYGVRTWVMVFCAWRMLRRFHWLFNRTHLTGYSDGSLLLTFFCNEGIGRYGRVFNFPRCQLKVGSVAKLSV